jgi:LacI family transcriptional regulator, repressor for deo operon, udp, cdd, tsx, nupC, and nupG
MADIFDVAKKAGVSKSTVSRVINSSGPVDEVTRKRVKAAMKQLKYSPDFFARGMRLSRTKTIGIIIPEYTNPFFPEWYKEFEKYISPLGYVSVIGITEDDPERETRVIRDMINRKVDAIIIWLYNETPANIKLLISLQPETPVVFMDPWITNKKVNVISANGFNSVANAVDYLVKKGIDRIAIIKGPADFDVTRERYEGFKAGLKRNKIQHEKSYEYEGDFYADSGYEAAKYFTGLKKSPQAIITVTDDMAAGALKYCIENRIKVPEQISIIGFNNQQITRLVQPELTTLEIPIVPYAELTYKFLMDWIENKDRKPIRKLFDCKLIIRESTLI